MGVNHASISQQYLRFIVLLVNSRNFSAVHKITICFYCDTDKRNQLVKSNADFTHFFAFLVKEFVYTHPAHGYNKQSDDRIWLVSLFTQIYICICGSDHLLIIALLNVSIGAAFFFFCHPIQLKLFILHDVCKYGVIFFFFL